MNSDTQLTKIEMQAALVDRMNLIQDTMRKIMKSGVDFGTIPGCGNKPCLFKAGAEKLLVLFNLRPTFELTPMPLDAGSMMFTAKCTLLNHNGEIVSESFATASTHERKFAKQDAGFALNVVAKFAQKRALVAATLLATGMSGIFTQDLEDAAPVKRYSREQHIAGILKHLPYYKNRWHLENTVKQAFPADDDLSGWKNYYYAAKNYAETKSPLADESAKAA